MDALAADQDEAFARRQRASAPRRSRPEERPRMARLLADAFATDPVISWLIRADQGRDKARERMFAALLGLFGYPGNEVWTADDHAVGALWIPPHRVNMDLTLWQELSLFPTLWSVVGWSGLPRMDAFRKAADHHHPTEPHWYLMSIGVDPRFQGQGLGSALLDATLRRIDETRLPAYLESSNAKNVPLYRRHGFEVTAEFRPLPDAPPLWGMWRKQDVSLARP